MRTKITTIIIFVGISILFGCSRSSGSQGILNKSKFVDVLVDIHMADAVLSVEGYRIYSDSTKIRLYYNDVLKKHNVTQQQIENTLKYYSKNPRQFENVYKEVSEKIGKLEEEYEKKNKTKDSQKGA